MGSDLFGYYPHWQPATVSDADHALRASLKVRDRAEQRARPFQSVRIGCATVTAAAFAPETGDIVIGLANGEVVSFQPRTGRTAAILPSGCDPIKAIAVGAHGRTIATACRDATNEAIVSLRGYRREVWDQVQYHSQKTYALPEPYWYYLSPLIFNSAVPRTFLSTSTGLVSFSSTSMIPHEHLLDREARKPAIFLVLPASEPPRESLSIQWRRHYLGHIDADRAVGTIDADPL